MKMGMTTNEVQPDDGRLPLGCPSANARWAFADAALVHKDDQTAFAPGLFKGWPCALLSTAHSIIVALDRPFLRRLRTQARSAKDTPGGRDLGQPDVPHVGAQ